MKLNVKAFALTCSVLWGLGIFLVTWMIIGLEGASGERTVLGKVYRGYRVTPLGSLVGLLWGLADCFVGGALFAWVYNRMLEYVKENVIEEKKLITGRFPTTLPGCTLWCIAFPAFMPEDGSRNRRNEKIYCGFFKNGKRPDRSRFSISVPFRLTESIFSLDGGFIRKYCMENVYCI